MAEGWIDVSERSGLIEEQRREGWVPLSAPRVFGGIRVRAVGRESKLVLKAGPLTASAAMEAELAISMLDAPTVILESGHLLASSEVGSAIVDVPSFGVWLRGAKLGALLEKGRLSVATLANLEVTKPGHRPELFPPGQEIVIHRDALQPYVLDPVLQVRLERDKKKRI